MLQHLLSIQCRKVAGRADIGCGAEILKVGLGAVESWLSSAVAAD